LFPSREPDDWREAQERQRAAADKLAEEWSKNDPVTVVNTSHNRVAVREAGISCMSGTGMSVAVSPKLPTSFHLTAALFNHNASPQFD